MLIVLEDNSSSHPRPANVVLRGIAAKVHSAVGEAIGIAFVTVVVVVVAGW